MLSKTHIDHVFAFTVTCFNLSEKDNVFTTAPPIDGSVKQQIGTIVKHRVDWISERGAVKKKPAKAFTWEEY